MVKIRKAELPQASKHPKDRQNSQCDISSKSQGICHETFPYDPNADDTISNLSLARKSQLGIEHYGASPWSDLNC
jgi:hypothetical protein